MIDDELVSYTRDARLRLLDEGGEDSPHELVGALLARLRLNVQVKQVSEEKYYIKGR